ncbi:MAG TPA: hypothetical protein VMC86_09910 [Gemmatimonadales bacterium]|nr:hypothetical protein [Gemmatimonadales bacterium]
MFRAILYQQWKWTRIMVGLATVAGFAVPIFSVRYATRNMEHGQAAAFLDGVQTWGVVYPALAGAVGVLIAIGVWTADHRGRHVYALTLPLPRWKYVLLRFAAGSVLVAGPIAGVTLGSVIAAASISLPAGLHAYPFALAVRFALATLVAFTMFFAVSSGTARTASIILGGLAALVVIQVLLAATGLETNILMPVLNAILTVPGPFAIFSGRWMLVDV